MGLDYFLISFCLSLLLIFLNNFLKSSKNRRKNKKYPPGPPSIPFFGNSLQVRHNAHEKFEKFAEKYGPIFSLKLMSSNAVVLTDYKIIKEALAHLHFSGRIISKFRTEGEKKGVLYNDGENWAEIRRFMLKNLRDLGLGKNRQEEILQQEISWLIEDFQKDVGKSIDIKNRFHTCVMNSIWCIVSGERFHYDSNSELITLVNFMILGLNTSTILKYLPFLSKLYNIFPFSKFNWAKSIKSSFEDNYLVKDFIKRTVQEHKATHQPNLERDLIDVYLTEVKKTTDKNSPFYGEIGLKNLEQSIYDLFLAGGETTATTMSWAFHLLAIHPEIQEKYFQEIKNVVGISRPVSLNDRQLMPYTEAVIHEILRYSSLASIGTFHKMLDDFELGGYLIPKDTTIITCLYTALHDKNYWKDPQNFRPDRFLSEDGKSILKHEPFLPFSSGKRVCMGEAFARNELLIFLTSLIQKFKIIPDPNYPVPSRVEYSRSATVLIPKHFPIILKDRN